MHVYQAVSTYSQFGWLRVKNFLYGAQYICFNRECYFADIVFHSLGYSDSHYIHKIEVT